MNSYLGAHSQVRFGRFESFDPAESKSRPLWKSWIKAKKNGIRRRLFEARTFKQRDAAIKDAVKWYEANLYHQPSTKNRCR